MFQFRVRSESRTRRPDSKGLLYHVDVLDVLVQHGDVVQSGWTVTDTDVRHAEPVSSCWTLAHTVVRRPDGSVAYEGAGLGLEALTAVLRAEGV